MDLLGCSGAASAWFQVLDVFLNQLVVVVVAGRRERLGEDHLNGRAAQVHMRASRSWSGRPGMLGGWLEDVAVGGRDGEACNACGDFYMAGAMRTARAAGVVHHCWNAPARHW
eukprot:364403-Chlamydomonas_euryale.AAC.2